MPVRRLPHNPNLEQIKKQAKTLQRAARAGDPEAVALVGEFHPRAADTAMLSLADAQLVLARHFGFPSWTKLRRHLDIVAGYSRSPHLEPEAKDEATEFLRLACLTHGGDEQARGRHAAGMLEAHPELASASVHTAAAAGDVAATAALLATDPASAGAEGGPHRWAPLLYLAYSTIDDRPEGRSHVETARLLLDAGADPNAGYLWEGLPSPYTALTGALSSSHSEPLALARLLLERGADANDSQALYELGFPDTGDDPAPLELLFEFGLGSGDGGVWHARLGPAHATPRQLVEDELVKAAAANRPRRARLVLDHGVDADGPGTSHPIFEGLSASELAVLNGSVDVAAMLERRSDPTLEFLGACIRADRPAVERLLAGDPSLATRAIARRPHQISVAADQDRPDAVALMIELGFDVNAIGAYPHRQTALHGAAFNGNLELVQLLIEHGADPTIEDCSFHSTPLGWAARRGQSRVVEYLATLGR